MILVSCLSFEGLIFLITEEFAVFSVWVDVIVVVFWFEGG